MAELSTAKTWRKTFIDVLLNEGPPTQSGGSDADDQNRQMLWEIKEALIAGTGAWTVVRSCGYDSGSWTYGDADYWLTSNDVRWRESGGEFSWIILAQTGINENFQMMIVCNYDLDDTEALPVYYTSDATGFTGGDATTIPTIPTESAVNYASTSTKWILQSEDIKVANVFQSDDGECTRIFINCDGSSTHYLWMIDKPKADTGLSDTLWPIQAVTCLSAICSFDDSATGYLFTAQTIASAVKNGSYADGGRVGCVFATEGYYPASYYGNSAGEIDPDISGAYLCSPLDLVSYTTGRCGILCRVQDLWVAPNSMAMGDMFPNDGSKEFVKIGCLIQPNDGTPLVLSY